MTDRTDILNSPDLKKNPFSVPDGYFSDCQKKALSNIKSGNGHSVTWRWLGPVAAAAMILLIAGNYIFFRNSHQEEYSQEDYMVFSNDFINTVYDMTSIEKYAEAEITDEDIIEYLIGTGVEAEIIEIYK